LGWALSALGLLAVLVIGSALLNNDEPASQEQPAALPTFTNMPLSVPPTDTPLPAVLPTDTPPPALTLPPPTVTPFPIAQPTLAVQLEPTATALTEPRSEAVIALGPTVNSATANLRSGPGTEYPTINSVTQGQGLEIVGKNEAGDWYQLAGGAWIAAFLVNDAPDALPVVSAPLTASGSGGATGNAQAFTCVGGCTTAPDQTCAIKGNVNSDNEMIYHMPGGRWYDKTDIKPEEGDRWFCTAQEAADAGFRAAQN
jgi:hypothetical protein